MSGPSRNGISSAKQCVRAMLGGFVRLFPRATGRIGLELLTIAAAQGKLPAAAIARSQRVLDETDAAGYRQECYAQEGEDISRRAGFSMNRSTAFMSMSALIIRFVTLTPIGSIVRVGPVSTSTRHQGLWNHFVVCGHGISTSNAWSRPNRRAMSFICSMSQRSIRRHLNWRTFARAKVPTTRLSKA